MAGSIRGCSRSHLTYIPGGSRLEKRKLTAQSPSTAAEFSVIPGHAITTLIDPELQ